MLKGRKVSLRDLEPQDAEILQKWYMDKDFRLAYDAYESIALDSILDEIAQSSGGIYDPRATKLTFLVLRKRDEKPIGVCCLRDIDRMNGNAELLLGIGEKDMRLAGFGPTCSSYYWISPTTGLVWRKPICACWKASPTVCKTPSSSATNPRAICGTTRLSTENTSMSSFWAC